MRLITIKLVIEKLLILFVIFPNIYSHSEIGKNVTFLSRSYTLKQWDLIKSTLKCFSNNGRWVNKGKHSGMLYDQPCAWSRYVQTKCDMTILSTNMTGLDYVWKSNTECSSNIDLNISPWNRDKMCKLLESHNILLLGDSLQDEWFSSIAGALINSSISNPRNISKSFLCGSNPIFKNSYRGIGGVIPYQQLVTSNFNCGNSIITNLRHDHFLIANSGDGYNRTILTVGMSIKYSYIILYIILMN